MYNISKEDQEVTIAQPNGSEKHFPYQLFDEYKTGYTVTYAGKSGGLDLIKMVPVKDNGVKVWFCTSIRLKSRLLKLYRLHQAMI